MIKLFSKKTKIYFSNVLCFSFLFTFPFPPYLLVSVENIDSNDGSTKFIETLTGLYGEEDIVSIEDKQNDM